MKKEGSKRKIKKQGEGRVDGRREGGLM